MAAFRRCIFRQLFDAESWTYTYLLGCQKTGEAVLIDPVDTKILEVDANEHGSGDRSRRVKVKISDFLVLVERDLKFIQELGLQLKFALNTHCHADHITGSGILKSLVACKSMISLHAGAKADVLLCDGDMIKFGEQILEARSTPGHTNGCMTFIDAFNRRAFTGDALLIRACGRTDFQQGDPSMLYDSVQGRILSLPKDFLLYPAHDYKGCSVTSVEEEQLYNPRLTKSKEEFVKIMENLGLARPKKIDEALPWNIMCGPSQLGQADKGKQDFS